MGWELEDVEKPFVAQLQALDWTYIEGSLDAPALTGRSSFTEVIQEGVLRERLRALNPGPDGQPWLDDARISEAVGEPRHPLTAPRKARQFPAFSALTRPFPQLPAVQT